MADYHSESTLEITYDDTKAVSVATSMVDNDKVYYEEGATGDAAPSTYAIMFSVPKLNILSVGDDGTRVTKLDNVTYVAVTQVQIDNTNFGTQQSPDNHFNALSSMTKFVKLPDYDVLDEIEV